MEKNYEPIYCSAEVVINDGKGSQRTWKFEKEERRNVLTFICNNLKRGNFVSASLKETNN